MSSSSNLSTLKTKPTFDAGRNIVAELIKQVKDNPSKEALVYQDKRLTYNELNERALSIAQQLSNLGIEKNDKVALLFPNHSDFVTCFFAIIGLGATVVPINPLLKADEISHILADSEAKALIVHEAIYPQSSESILQSNTLKHVLVSTYATALPNSINDTVSFHALTIDTVPSQRKHWQEKVDDKQIAVLIYTSGTTGKPKGAMLTHSNLLSIFPQRLSMFDANSSDRCLAVLPLCHIYGLTVVMIGTISFGSTLVVLSKFDAKATLELIEKEKVTLMPAVPAMYQFMLMEMANQNYDMSSVRICFSGAASMPVELISKIESCFAAPLIEGYALTETSCAATINPLHGKRKAGSVGLPLSGVEIKISGEAKVGEILIKGPNIMQGYFNLPEATIEVLKDNWFATGDLGYKDDDGYLFIVGRKKELIIRGGQNIYPKEVEEVLQKLPEVKETAVIGVPDQLMGERVKAFVVLKPGTNLSEQAIKDYCDKHLANYKVPRLIEFIDCLPRNSTGKVLKRLLN